MTASDSLVSIGLPVRNAGTAITGVVHSVLAQDHGRLELVISDNASTDDTEEVCRALAQADARIVYHRQPTNIGLLPNFIAAIRLARGEYFRWIGDDDLLEPTYVSRSLPVLAADNQLLLVTSQISYAGPDGLIRTDVYDSTRLRSDDPVERFGEMLRLLNESYTLIDPLYALMRRQRVAAISRRAMLREDEVFATKLALAGKWAHLPEVLAHRHWKVERLATTAGRLGVPAWQSHFANLLQYRAIADSLREVDLTDEQRVRARGALRAWYLRRQRIVIGRRSRKLAQIVGRH